MSRFLSIFGLRFSTGHALVAAALIPACILLFAPLDLMWLGITLGVFRIITGTPLHWYIITGYTIVIIQSMFAPRTIIALAYDSGGVTTSTVTVPLVTALGLGLAGSIPGRSPLLDGFGLVAFASLFPIMSVMAYAQLGSWWVRRGQFKHDEQT